MKIHSGASQFIPKNTASKKLHEGPGRLRAIIASVDTVAHSDGSLTLFDNTAASGAVLIVLNVHPYQPAVILFDRLLPLTFENGLTAVTSAYLDAFVISEA